MNYCRQCVMPDTRPGTDLLEDGICTACHFSDDKKSGEIDWNKRRKSLMAIAENVRGSSASGYDCVVPVSGGKDSIYQTHIVKEVLGLKPLCVTYQCACRTPEGEYNIQIIKNMADHVEFSPAEPFRKSVTLRALEETGDCCWLCHRLIFSYPIRVALSQKIPLVVYGENSQLEYGGTEEDAARTDLDTTWLELHGMQHGKTTNDWVDGHRITSQDANAVEPPSVAEIQDAGLRSIFLGYYLPWDSWENLEVAKKYGFKVRADRAPEGALHNFKDIDCKFMTFHHYFKWLKFGYSRVTDHASIDVRSGLLGRDQAVEFVREREGEPPMEYMHEFCDYLGITEKRFWEIADSYRNPQIWKKNSNGEWFMPDFICAHDWGWSNENK